ncbi:xanthine dehydrogenase, molybdenum binding subunit apoprotein [Rhodopseudomonas palustris HaA2]|uniref:Xanthine dehydrogenase, molybdenum binding subunit apoprotein n=1 Tax=Rhodopseudomonas palustris (strain HaA2) TaxID=316058 RepID=Q2IVG6_RHOP2|nr:xanthine dehydrogenase family protein molybdopterin-binding subunit [Rhodopseudomonas palustris]ABD07794.1 xanthine dehydrogenase, molybdenum binding subunit apoprotein [Rhodopseudomonas palustris HaA2]
MAETGGFIGKSVPRREDKRLLTGKGEFVADLKLPSMLHAAFVRSQVAHGRIKSVDLSRALRSPGVVYAISGPDLAKLLPPVPDTQLSLPKKWTTRVQHTFLNPQQPLLAYDKVRHVGEAVAVILAESRYLAEDAAELVTMEIEPLPAVVDPEAGLTRDSAVLHEQYDTNLIGDFAIAKGDVETALANAPHRMKRRFYHHRYAAIPMEGRGVAANYDARTDSINIWSACQVIHWLRREASTVLGMPEARIRCVALDVGGGFGVKGHVYPEELLIPYLAREVGRPVKWIEDRHEHFMSACHSRDQTHDVEFGFDDDGRLLAFQDEFLVDCGAWNPIGSGIAYNTAVHLPGPYKFEHFAVRSKIVATNKVPNAPYRGAGRPEATFAMERVIDLIAAELGLDPADVRMRNMIPASEMPYRLGLPYRDGEPIVYDSGDYPESLRQALAALGGVDAFRDRQRAARAQGRYFGLGLGCYVEGTGVGPFESATVRVDPTGKIYLAGGACPQGQGMETIFSQIVADAWQVQPDDVVVALADTSVISIGFGTIASRSTVNLSGAIHTASQSLQKKVFAIAADMLECSPADLELRNGTVGLVGVPGREIPLARIAKAAMPGWDNKRPAGVSAGLEETAYFEPPTVTWAYATHAAIVELDVELGRVEIEKYVIVHDCGVVVNPMLVDGQINGGAVQGLGGALLEELSYDSEGQLLVGSFMDYLVPGASDVPHFELKHMHFPSPLNPYGVKGVGEGSAIAPPVVIANAVSDALSHLKVEFNSTPIRPEHIVTAFG